MEILKVIHTPDNGLRRKELLKIKVNNEENMQVVKSCWLKKMLEKGCLFLKRTIEIV